MSNEIAVNPPVMAEAKEPDVEKMKLNLLRRHITMQVDSLLRVYMTKIRQAAEANGNKLSISMKIDLDGFDPVDVKTAITFTPEKISFNITGKVSFDQENLFTHGKEETI